MAVALAAAPPQVHFNLLTKPWIPVMRSDGTPTELSLVDCLAQAQTLRSIQESSPLVVIALNRLLAAVLQRIEQPDSVNALAAVLKRGQVDQEKLRAFAATYGDRFDLFAPSHP